jgi:hypothetical protein
MVTRNRTSSRNHHRKAGTGRRERVDPAAVSVVRLTAGALSLGWQELGRRLDAVPELDKSSRPAARDLRGSTTEYLVVGAAVELAAALTRVAESALGYGRSTLAVAEYVAELPVIRIGTDSVRSRLGDVNRMRRRMIRRGRYERAEGRRIVRHVVEYTASRSVKEIAETAVHQVSSSPEIAQLVRTQSAGITSDTIQVVRTTSEQADERLESRVHSWLNLRKPAANEPHSPEPPPAA